MVKNMAKSNRKNEETTPSGIRACITSLGPMKEFSPLKIERSSSCLNKYTYQPRQNKITEGVRNAIQKNANTQLNSAKNPNNLIINIPERVTLKPRMNRKPLRLVGKSLDQSAAPRRSQFTPKRSSDVNWGRLPPGGERYYRPNMNESTMIDSLKDYFTTKLTDINPENTSRLSRYQGELSANERYKKLRQRGKTDISRNTWATV